MIERAQRGKTRVWVQNGPQFFDIILTFLAQRLNKNQNRSIQKKKRVETTYEKRKSTCPFPKHLNSS